VSDHHGRFVWYELITTDVAAAKVFYADVVGWGTQDAPTPDFAYTLLTAGTIPVGGVTELPEIARQRGATPRWAGYVAVKDIDVTAGRIKRLGGAVYVPPTDSNIGRIAIVADPQTANFALIKGLKPVQGKPVAPGKAGHVGWHELHATNWEKALAFYVELFGWQKTNFEINAADPYQPFSIDGPTIGGMLTKPITEPVPFWLYYFNVGDIDEAAERVRRAGGRIFTGPLELPGGAWIVRCVDPQGAPFALQGTRREEGIGWSTEWGGFSSKGKLVPNKPRS
jgi:predicted enzyme related to lactoylglutathione lyase